MFSNESCLNKEYMIYKVECWRHKDFDQIKNINLFNELSYRNDHLAYITHVYFCVFNNIFLISQKIIL